MVIKHSHLTKDFTSPPSMSVVQEDFCYCCRLVYIYIYIYIYFFFSSCFNRPSLAGDVLQTMLLLINWLGEGGGPPHSGPIQGVRDMYAGFCLVSLASKRLRDLILGSTEGRIHYPIKLAIHHLAVKQLAIHRLFVY